MAIELSDTEQGCKPSGYAAVGLVDCKTDGNAAGALRAAHCFDAAMIAVQGGRLKKSALNTTKAERHIPLILVDDVFDVIPDGCKVVAVELAQGASSLFTFAHPKQAFYLFGREDGSLPPEVIRRCDAVVQIPTRYCMNLAATVNVVLYDRAAKRACR